MDEKTYIAYARMAGARATPTATTPKTYPVSIALADETDYTHTGQTDFLNNTLDASTGSMRARAVLPNTDMFLTPGMFGRVRMTLGTSAQAVLIPDSAIMIDQSRKFVFTVNTQGVVTSQTVEAGALAHDGLRIITKGLSGSEKIITSGLQRARDGITVKTENPQAPSTQGKTK
jgi:RND family efflux transporter MFP subunit